LASIHKRQADIEKEKKELSQNYLKKLLPTGSNSFAVSKIHCREAQRISVCRNKKRAKAEKTAKEERDEEALLEEVNDMEIETVDQ
jgi:hypothetical protein